MTSPRRSAHYSAAEVPTLPDKWVTRTNFSEIESVLGTARTDAAFLLGTDAPSSRSPPSPGPDTSSIVFVAHRECSTVFWSASRDIMSGSLCFQGHFFQAGADSIEQSGGGDKTDAGLRGTIACSAAQHSAKNKGMTLKTSPITVVVMTQASVPEPVFTKHTVTGGITVPSSSQGSDDPTCRSRSQRPFVANPRGHLSLLPNVDGLHSTRGEHTEYQAGAHVPDHAAQGWFPQEGSANSSGAWTSLGHIPSAEATVERLPVLILPEGCDALSTHSLTPSDLVDGFRALLTHHRFLQAEPLLTGPDQRQIRLDKAQIRHIHRFSEVLNRLDWPSELFDAGVTQAAEAEKGREVSLLDKVNGPFSA